MNTTIMEIMDLPTREESAPEYYESIAHAIRTDCVNRLKGHGLPVAGWHDVVPAQELADAANTMQAREPDLFRLLRSHLFDREPLSVIAESLKVDEHIASMIFGRATSQFVNCIVACRLSSFRGKVN